FHDAITKFSSPRAGQRIVDTSTGFHPGGFRRWCAFQSKTGYGIYGYLLDIDRRGNEETDRAVDSSIVRPVARTTSREHGFIEGIIDLHDNQISFTEAKQ